MDPVASMPPRSLLALVSEEQRIRPWHLAQRALLRKVGEPNPDPEVVELEREILPRVNNIGVGPMRYGGRTTALSAHAEVFPSHIPSLPVAVNRRCWCSRHREAILIN